MSKPPNKPLYVFFGHHKCATGWIDSILRETCFHLGWRFRIVHRPVDFAAYGSLARLVEAEPPDVLAYTNADRNHLAGLPAFRAFHVIRDPRDVIVSGYFSHRNSHPTDGWPALAEHRVRLLRASKEEGLFLEMAFSKERLLQIGHWQYTRPDVLELKMETLTTNTAATFCDIYAFLGMLERAPRGIGQRALRRLVTTINVLNQRGRRYTPFHWPLSPVRFPLPNLSPERVEAIVRRKNFARLAGGRRPGQEDPSSHYRKGQAGDWRNHFTAEHAAYFEQHFGDLLVSLGYETDNHWHVFVDHEDTLL